MMIMKIDNLVPGTVTKRPSKIIKSPYVADVNINNTELPNIIYIDNPEKKSMEDVLVDISCSIGENTIHIHSLYNDKKEAYTQLFTTYLGVSSKFIMIYLQELRKDNIITWQDYLLLIRLMTKNTHKIRDLLINLIINAFILC